MKNTLFKLLAFVPMLTACDDLFEPAIENIRDISAMETEPSYAQGFLANAYILLPYLNAWDGDVVCTDLATDDAVSNKNDNAYLKMATGSWSATNSPDRINQWVRCYNAIQYINIMLEHCDKVQWSTEPALRALYNDHFKGEAYAMRSLFLFHLLRSHAGMVNGELLGVPIHLEPETGATNYVATQTRNTFIECVERVIADADSALALLPYVNGSIKSENELPARYKAIGATVGDYNRAYGDHQQGKIDGKIIETIRAQVMLMAASPAYEASGVKWEQAADYAAISLAHINGISGMDPNGHTWYNNIKEIDALESGKNQAEVIWRDNWADRHEWEANCYPPSLYGNGRVNPTQNLVDAFPMLNGYPINHASSEYDANNPYANRDPRLANYILCDGGTFGVENKVIDTKRDPSKKNLDGFESEGERSTRTGYYLRKLLRSDVNLDPAKITERRHYAARIRYTEMFLIYAEAANEAWGPEGTGSHSYSARDVIAAIRKRAGITQPDAYLASITSKEDMRELIRNERRLELCFENFRFWDLRRWKVSIDKLTESAQGMEILKNSDGTCTYNRKTIEDRKYSEYMYYGPIPQTEMMKWSPALQQNQGW